MQRPLLTFPAIPVQVALVLAVCVAAFYDVRFRRIPNWITLAAFLAGLGLNGWLHGGPGLLLALMGGGLAMLIYFPLYLARGMGAGDVKLMAAVGALAGAGNWLGIFFLTVVSGAVIGLVLVTMQGRLRRTLANLGYLIRQVLFRHLPYLRREELDVRSGKGWGLPHGALAAIGTIEFLLAAWMWAPR